MNVDVTAATLGFFERIGLSSKAHHMKSYQMGNSGVLSADPDVIMITYRLVLLAAFANRRYM